MSDGCIRWYSSAESERESRHLREGREDTSPHTYAVRFLIVPSQHRNGQQTFALPCVGTNKRVPLWLGELPFEKAMYASARALGKNGGHCTALHCLHTRAKASQKARRKTSVGEAGIAP
jgi:hypothetical protein